MTAGQSIEYLDAASLGAEIESQISLVNWPSMTEVPSVRSVDGPPTRGSRYSDFMWVLLDPEQTLLPNEWYAVRLSAVPTGTQLSPTSWHQTPSGYFARFYTGSLPEIETIEFCPAEDEPSVTDVRFVFTETVTTTFNVDQVVHFSAGGQSVPCSGQYALPTPSDDFIVNCTGLPWSSTISVGLDPNKLLTQSSGYLGAASHQMILDALESPPGLEGCRAFVAFQPP